MRRFRHLVTAAARLSVWVRRLRWLSRRLMWSILRLSPAWCASMSRPPTRIARRFARRSPVPRCGALPTDTGIDVDRLSAAVSTMSVADAERAADAARQVNDSLVGGASSVTISTTTIIIALLVIILLIVALD